MAQTLESLVVDLRARTKHLERDLDKANRAIARKMKVQGRNMANNLSSGFTKAFGKLAAITGVGIGLEGIRRGIIDTVKTSSQLQTTADKLGLTTTELQELRYAANQFNIEQRTTDMALQRFTRRLGEADQGTGELKATLDQYNISTRDSDNRMRSTTDVLREFADVIANAETEQERLRLGFKAFDSEGAAFVNVLREGSAGLSDLSSQAHAFGQIIEADHLRRLKEVDERWKNVIGNFNRFKTDILSGALNLTDFMGLTGLEGELKRLEREMDSGRLGKIAGESGMIDLGVDNVKTQEDLDKLKMQFDITLSELVEKSHVAQNAIAKELENATINRNQFDSASEPFALWDRRIQRLTESAGELDAQERQLIDKYPQAIALIQDIVNAEQGRGNALSLTADETARLNSLLASTITPAEKFQDQVELLERSMKAFPGRAAEFEEALSRIRAAYEEELREDKLNQFGAAWEGMSKRMSGSISEALIEGDDALDNFLNRMVTKLAAAALETAIIAPLFNAVGLGGSGGLLGGILGFAGGGNPPVGQPYMVGEHGPELRVDRTPGTIIPNRALTGMGGGGDTINIEQHNHFPTNLDDVRRQIAQAAPLIAQATEAQIVESRRRGRR